MPGVIKSVLKEELNNSLRMKKAYEQELRKLPAGNVSIKKISGQFYAYKVRREGKKVRFRYVGKVSEDDWKRNSKVKQLRAKYRNLLSLSKKQIRYLKGALRGKEAI